MFETKPNLNNNCGVKQFPTKKEAVNYLGECTGFTMSWERNKKTGEITYDRKALSGMKK